MGLVIAASASFALLLFSVKLTKERKQENQKAIDLLEKEMDKLIESIILTKEFNLPPGFVAEIQSQDIVKPLELVGIVNHYRRTGTLPNWFVAKHFAHHKELLQCFRYFQRSE